MPKEIKLSATRVSTFLECKQKYWFNYMDHLPKTTNPAFRLGLAVHETLEFAGKIWKKKEKFDPEDRKKIRDVYNEASVREGIDDLTLHKEGIELVNRRLDSFALGKKLVSLEWKFGMFGNEDIMTRDGVLLIGAIDKVEEIDQDTLLIIDYKTSSTAPTGDQLKNDLQLSIYDLVASLKWPEYERVILCLDLLKHNPVYTYRTEEEREEFSDYLKTVHDSMCGLTKRDAKPSLNIFCPWCSFNNYCNAYRKAYEKTNYTFEAIEGYEDSDLVSEWQKMRNTKKIIEARERELAMLVIEKIRRTGSNLVGKEEEIYIRQNSRKTYNSDVVHDLVPEKAFLKMVKLNNRAVEKYISNRPAIKDKVMDKTEINYTSPFLATKKLKKK